MSESEVRIPNPEIKREERVPEKYDHRGLWFESPQQDSLLTYINEGLETSRAKPNVYDLLDIVRFEKADIKDQKTRTMHGQKQLKESDQELSNIQDTLIDVATGQGAEVADTDKDLVTAYLMRQKNRWGLKTKDENIDPATRKAAEQNEQLFISLQDTLFSPDSIKKAHDEIRSGSEQAERFANTHEVKENKVLPKEEETYPEFTYQPTEAVKALKKLREKDVALSGIRDFYTAVAMDIDAQQKAFGEKYPGWLDKKKAVTLAVHFLQQHQNEDRAQDGQILVSLLPDGAMHAGWELSSRNPDGTKQYAFSLNDDGDSPNSLSKNATEISEYDNRLQSLERTQQIIDVLEAGETVSADDARLLTIYTDEHRNFIENKDQLSKGDRKDRKILQTIAKKIMKKIDWDKGKRLGN